MDTQKQELLEYLQRRGSVTPLEALAKLGIYRLSARVYDLRNDGWLIDTSLVEGHDRRGKRTKTAVYTYIGRSA